MELIGSLESFLSEGLLSSSKPRLFEVFQAGTSEQGKQIALILSTNDSCQSVNGWRGGVTDPL